MQTITLIPSRIGCPSIPGTMKGILMSIPGVEEAVVHYEARSLDVTFDPSATSVAAIVEKIGKEMGLAMREKTKVDGDQRTAAETCPM